MAGGKWLVISSGNKYLQMFYQLIASLQRSTRALSVCNRVLGLRVRRSVYCVLAMGLSLAGTVRAEYYNFNVASGSEAIMQEARWPSFCAHFYDTLYQGNPVLGSQGETASFYGGMPHDCGWAVPCRIIWSFFSVKNSAPGAMVTPYWLATNMYAPPHVGEGADSKAAGDWSILQTNRWYREVIRIWPAVDGSTNTGYVARWLRDSATSNWYHMATMKVPYTPTGLDGLSGFKESLSPEDGSSRTDYRNVYYRMPGGSSWQRANVFNPSTRLLGQRGAAALIESNTAAFFEMGTDLLNMASNPPPVSGTLYLMVSTNEAVAGLLTNTLPAGMQALASPVGVVLTITNQPLTPTLDPIVVSGAAAYVYKEQMLVNWQIPATSSPQFAYKIEVFNNSNYTGSAAVTFNDIDPEARQKLLNITGVTTPYARLTIMDVVYQTNAPVQITPVAATLQTATNVTGAVNGLAYKYYESVTGYTALPNFAALTPLSQGAVNFPDLSPRKDREHYAFNFNGYFNVAADGLYAFTVNSSDGSKLIIDGVTVVDWDGVHSLGPKTGWIGLQAGKHVVNVQYFFNEANPDAKDQHDFLTLSYAGPGFAETEIPLNAWFRVPGAGEPVITLSTPVNGATLCGSNIALVASVTANSATPNGVQYYVNGTWFGTDTLSPYSTNAFLWAAPSNAIFARLLYNGSNAVDSAPNLVTTTNADITPWTMSQIGQWTYPAGAKKTGGTCSLLGDGLVYLHQQVSGDCTIVARRSAMLPKGTKAPDGNTANTGWDAGIMLRQNTNYTPGAPLGSTEAKYASVYCSVGGGSYFQDYTMNSSGGPYASANLGSYSWFKLQRVGDTFTTFVSNDGSTWTAVNTNTLTGIGSVLYAGVFTYAAWSQNPNVFWASFDNISMVGNLLSPPSVAVSPDTQGAYAGQSATFTAQANGNPPFTYQWQYNNVNLSGATNATLTLTNLQPGQSGYYRVLLGASNGNATATGVLTVGTLPAGQGVAAATVLSNSPFAYWRLNEQSGATAYESLGSYNGTYNAVTLGGAGPRPADWPGFETTNAAAQFDGTNSYVGIGSLGLAGPLTLSAWIKPVDVSRQQGILSEPGSYFLKINGGSLLLRVGGSDYSMPADLTPNVWQQVAVTLTPNTTGGIQFYKNGEFIGATNAPALTAGTSSFWIGKNQYAAQFFAGSIDEVVAFNRALTATEIQNQYLAAANVPPSFVTLTAPTNGAAFTAATNIAMAAVVVTNGHAISSVQFYSGTNLLGVSSNAPYGYSWTNVPAGTYTLLAQAVYDGTNLMSSLPSFISVVAPPSTPGGLAAFAGNAQVALNWSVSAGATSYNVKRATTSGGPYTTLANVGTNAYTDTTALNEVTYFYVVSAVNLGGESTNSAQVSATPISQIIRGALADAYVRGGTYTNNNFGTESNLTVKLAGTSVTREAFLKFDVSGLTNAQSVIIQLMTVDTNTIIPTFNFEFVADDSWTENGITWNTKPAGSGTIFTNLGGFAAGVPVQINVTSRAKTEAAGDGLLTMRIYSSVNWGSSADLSFGSKEQSLAANRPQLVAILPAARPALIPPVITNAVMVSGTGFLLSGTGQINQAYGLSMTTNLAAGSSWSSLTTNPGNADGTFQFLDVQATNAPRRFYRVFAP